MKKIVKQVAGIDVAQKELVVSLGRMHDDWSPEVYAHKTFANTETGFLTLIIWVKKQAQQDIAVRFVMEATGVYHESLAYFLTDKNFDVSIVLPNKISNYFRTLDVKTITDKTASEAITLFGLERKLDSWQQSKGLYKKLRQLTRERGQLVEERTAIKNQLHAEQAEAEPNKKTSLAPSCFKYAATCSIKALSWGVITFSENSLYRVSTDASIQLSFHCFNYNHFFIVSFTFLEVVQAHFYY